MSVISRRPSSPPAVRPDDARYFDAADLEAEAKRVFQVCHECRMCVNYCGSFPALFAAVDRDIEAGRAEGAEKITPDDRRLVTDLCWQCKLCYIKCPYTADEDAAELLDFPRLMAREKADRSRREGVPLVDKLLGEPGRLGQAAGGFRAPLSNFVGANKLARRLQEKATGISAEFPLPSFEAETFPAWLARHAPAAGAGGAGEVTMFSTCTGDYNSTAAPKAAVRVLEHQGFKVLRPQGEVCCGMPNLDGGDLAAMRFKVEANVAILYPLVERGRKVVAMQPTCGYTMKHEWPVYSNTPETHAVAKATVDVMEFLEGLRRAKTLKKDFQRGLGQLTYHAACHLRAQKIAIPGLRLLSLVPDTDVRMVEQCSAVDGTWGMKAKNYEMGRKYAQKLVREINETPEATVVTDCPLSGLRIQKETGRLPVHPIEALQHAYGLAPDDDRLAAASSRTRSREGRP